MIESWKIKIPSLTGEKERRAYIYLPADYSTERRYPVMYMFDGHNLFFDSDATFGRSWRLAEYLDDTKTPVIVAAVECNDEGNGRLEEYSPLNFTLKDGTFIKGSGKKYMDWLVRDFKPYIDANFATLPDKINTAIGGSSMGGLMALYAVSKYGRYFSKAAALSPSLWVNGGKVLDFVLNGGFSKNTHIYTDYGSKEFSNHSVQKEVFAETCSALIKKGVNLTARIVAGGTHCEASWQKRIPDFMRALGFLPED